MLAVHFGAGNIGRGFIGLLLSQAGYDICFVDVNGPLIDEINELKQYTIIEASCEKKKLEVSNIYGLNSRLEEEKVIEVIVKADLVTTAVGPNVLPFVAKTLAKGIEKRIAVSERPLNVIACENMIGASKALLGHVLEELTSEVKKSLEGKIGFPNCTVDRIVPDQTHHVPLMVEVEPFFEWVVEEAAIVGEKPEISGVTYVRNLEPYIERKLFTVNTGHSVLAYLGYFYQLKTVKEAVEQADIRHVLEGALEETGRLLVEKHGFDSQIHREYVKKIIERFRNPYINDEVTRVARGPIRKLGLHERLVGPSRQFLELVGEIPENLSTTIAAVLLYDYPKDKEAVELQERIEKVGVKIALEQCAALVCDDPLIDVVLKQYNQLEKR